MDGEFVHATALPRTGVRPSCAPLSDPKDKELPAVAALMGALVAVASVGLVPFRQLPVLGIGLAAGFILFMLSVPNLPVFNGCDLSLM